MSTTGNAIRLLLYFKETIYHSSNEVLSEYMQPYVNS